MGSSSKKPLPADEYSGFGSEECANRCIDLYLPVCGTDNITYTNECFLRCERERQKTPDVEVEFFGACEDPANATTIPIADKTETDIQD